MKSNGSDSYRYFIDPQEKIQELCCYQALFVFTDCSGLIFSFAIFSVFCFVSVYYHNQVAS